MIVGRFVSDTGIVGTRAEPLQGHAAPLDSVVVESPLPGGVATVVRFLLNEVPPWVQMGGVVLAVMVGALAAWYVFRRRRDIHGWVTTRSPRVMAALAVAVVVLMVGAGIMGAATWNYTQHSNDFCTGCHVMNPAVHRFATLENKHAELSCHDCHQQPISASVRQLYLWVAERPDEIGEHAKVPNQVCENCHVTGDTARWQRIATTAGHRVHLESDSSTLANLQCVTCHGVEVHKFRPVNATCGQSDCHKPSETEIVLGKMATQTVQHCAGCHEFTAEVPTLATRDSARGTLVPGQPQCMGCHEMRLALADFEASRDPHGAKCGSCHNPHTQRTPAAATSTCAECHSDWRNEPFHVGANHRRIAEQCTTCHLPHSAKVDASGCEECHRAVRSRGGQRPPLPFDTSAALRRTGSAVPHAPLRPIVAVAMNVEPVFSFAGSWEPSRGYEITYHSQPPPALADTFPHSRHARLACLECHRTGTGEGRLTFEPPRGCQICHHQAPRSSNCSSCHRTSDYSAPQPTTLSVTVSGHAPRARPLDFLHARHVSTGCLECHTTPVTLAPSPAKAQCRDCHADHHTVDRGCASCHAAAEPRAVHTLEAAHQRCDACHATSTVARLTPTRSFCSTCHQEQAADHYPRRECTTCHFLSEPAAHRSTLMTRPEG